jgi:hypothetical protein
MSRHTHTYVTLEISAAGYDEIARKLRDADYGHCFNSSGEIDMTGIAVVRAQQPMKYIPKVEEPGRCANCGGIHYGSVGCPYLDGVSKQGAVEKSTLEQAGMQNEAKS